jgi:sec-independent protein translocase protein TatC
MPHELEDHRPELDGEEDEGGPVKTFLEHLEDLRWVIIKCLTALVLAMVVCLAASPWLMAFLKRPLLQTGAAIEIQFLGPLGGIFSSMKIAFYGGLCIALPFLLYFIGEYIMPALKRSEKKFFLRAFMLGGVLFLAGVSLCYFVALQISLKGMAAYNAWLGLPADLWRAEEYFQFVTLFMILMGLCFELPIILLSLVKLGIIDHTNLRKSRPYFILGISFLIAFITPDFVSTIFLVVPVLILIEICIWIAWYWDRQRKRAEEALAATEAPDKVE